MAFKNGQVNHFNTQEVEGTTGADTLWEILWLYAMAALRNVRNN